MTISKVLMIITVQLWLANFSQEWFFPSENCYHEPELGCFPVTGHFYNAMGFAPQSPSEVGVQFVFKGTDGDIVFPVEQTREVMQDVYDPSLKTVFIIHGYLESSSRSWISRMVAALKRRGPLNLFVVDWRAGAMNINYLQCVANSRMTGAITALLLQELIDQLGASPFTFHIVGFSLGAHVAGYVGERVRGIGRITGLDPAGPGFVDTNPSVRLDSTDAVVVDVIHTDKDMGTLMPMGTVDFYPNGGADQPACAVGTIARISFFMRQMDFSRSTVTRTLGCSHIRATQLFTSSINNDCGYILLEAQDVEDMRDDIGSLCVDPTCPMFGYNLRFFQTPRPGIYRFPTQGTHPFC